MKRLVPLMAAVVLAGCAGGGYGDNLGSEPTSLSDLSALGGASHTQRTINEIAGFSHLAVEVEVLDVKKTRLNTHDGRFPSEEDLALRGLDGLVALTDVSVRVIRTIASAEDVNAIAPGEEITITLGGGLYDTVVNQEQATILGIQEVTLAGEPREHVEGEDAPPDVEVETPIQSDRVPLTWGHSPSVEMAEGETLVLFLVDTTVSGYLTDDEDFMTVFHPRGVLRGSGDRWSDPIDGTLVNLNQIKVLGKPLP